MSSLPPWLKQLLPIVLLLATVAVVLVRLPKVELGHSEAFKRRRFLNWFPLGLTYAFLYMGRYNLNAATSALGGRTDERGLRHHLLLGHARRTASPSCSTAR